MKIKGVGRRTAEAIMEYRNRHGPFRTIEDLVRVDGVSTVLKDRIAQVMRLDRPPR
jgi:competence ComEA-like helix-hairpin-helix protein